MRYKERSNSTSFCLSVEVNWLVFFASITPFFIRARARVRAPCPIFFRARKKWIKPKLQKLNDLPPEILE
jgi:hypothetical protein